MDVTSIRIGAFKSLYDVPCPLEHFTVITGPNGAGKSNFVEALNFLGETHEHGLEIAISRAGGYENIAHRRTRRAKSPVSFEVNVLLDRGDLKRLERRRFAHGEDMPVLPNEAALIYRQSFSIRTATQAVASDFRISEESVQVLDSQSREIMRITHNEGRKPTITVPKRRRKSWETHFLFPYLDRRYVDLIARELASSELITETFAYPTSILGYVSQRLARSRVFQLSPQECRRPGVPTPNAILDRFGSNLPAAADFLKKRTPEAWKQVQGAMRSIIPGLQGIDVAFTEDRRLTLQFRERRVGRPWTTGEVSDGTIQALALFVALYDERAPLLIIEEPENSIHPWILRQFIDLCREHTEKQIILTTHSPVVLNYVGPKPVRLMWRQDGKSRLARLIDLEPNLVDSYLRGEISVFEAYDSGLINQTVPAGFVTGSEIDGDLDSSK